MKRYFLFIITFFLLATNHSYATNYYVSASGNDSNDGLSDKTAWKSIEKVNAEMNKFVAGDIIAFRRGDEFYGNLLISRINGVEFTSYGTGDKAILTRGKILNGWSKIKNNIYELSQDNQVYQVFSDGQSLPNGRTPNKGFYNITSVISQTEFVSKDLIGMSNLIGTTVHIKSRAWIIDNEIITAFDSSTGRVTIAGKTVYNFSSGNEFFLQNSINLLDKPNEWSYDSSKEKVYIYSLSPPKNVKISYKETDGIQVYNSSNIVINNLVVNYANNYGVYLNKSSHCKVQNNEINFAYEIGVYSRGGTDNIISNNIIKGSMYRGIRSKTDHTFIENNRVTAIGLEKNLTYKRSWSSTGISIDGNSSIIRNNKITNVGYNGLAFEGQDLIISNNFINDFCSLLSDGGGIYAYNPSYSNPIATGTVIEKNIVIGGSSPDLAAGVFCIYMDDKTHDVTVKNNSLSGTDRGVFLHNTKRVKVRNNNIYKPLGNGINISEDKNGGNGETVDNVIEYNTVFIENSTLYNYPLNYKSSYDNWNLGTSNYNKFYNPYADKNIGIRTQSIYGFNPNFPKSMNLSEWQEFSGNDLNSIENDFYWDSFIVNHIIGNNLIKNGKFDKNIENWSKGHITTSLTKDNGSDYLVGKASSEKGSLISNHFTVKKGKDYLLEFDIKSNSKTKFQLDIALGEKPYGTEDRRLVYGEEEWKHYAIPFNSTVSTEHLKVEFTIFKNKEIHLDNVSFKEVEFSTEPLPTRSHFAYNKEMKNQAIGLPSGNWKDLDGNKYVGSVVLKPFTSKILILSDGSISANAGNDVFICSGESIILTASGGSSYMWSTGETTQSITVSPSTTKTYTVTVSEGDESDLDEVIVTVNNVIANAGLDKSIEEGQSVKLTASGGDSYLWSTGSTEKSITVSPESTTNYTVTVYENECEDTDEVQVVVKSKVNNPSPVEAFAGDDISICLGEKVILTANGGDSYTWSTGSTKKNIEVNPTRTTTYTLSATRSDVTDIDAVTVTVENCLNNDKNISIYPNPTKGKLIIEINDLEDHLDLFINDSRGSLIYFDQLSIQVGSFSKYIDMSRYAKGVYFVRLINSSQDIIKKIVLI